MDKTIVHLQAVVQAGEEIQKLVYAGACICKCLYV